MISYLSNWIIELITHSIFQVYKWTRVSNSQPNYPNCDKYPLHSRIYRKSGQRVCRTQRTSSDVPQRCFQSPIYQPISTGTATLWATHRCTLSCAWFVFFDFYSLLLFFFPFQLLNHTTLGWWESKEREKSVTDRLKVISLWSIETLDHFADGYVSFLKRKFSREIEMIWMDEI